MKKLLSAVTSAAMSTSLMASAFASSTTVSAAGSSTAVQPNVSMGDVLDVSAKKTADVSYDVKSDYVVTVGDYTAKPGQQDLWIDVYADPGSHMTGILAVKLGSLPTGFKVAEVSEDCEAANKTWKEMNGQYICEAVKGADPIVLDKTKPAFSVRLTVSNDVAPGNYTLNLERFHVVEASENEYDATVKAGTIKIEGNGNNSQPDTTAAPNNNNGYTVASDFIVKPGTYTVDAADDDKNSYVDVMVDDGGHKVGLQAIKLDTSKLPAGIKFDDPEEESPATGKSWKESNGQWILETLKGGDTVSMNTDEAVVSYHFTVADDVPSGKYEFTFSRWHVAETADKEFDATVQKGYIVVNNDSVPGTTVVQYNPSETTTKNDSGSVAQQGQKDFVVKPGTYTASKNTEDNYIDVMVESGSHKVGLQAVKLDTSKLPKGITFDAPEEESESTGKSWKESNGQYILETLKGGDTVALDDSKPIMSIHYNVADSVADGKYEFTFSRWHVAEKADTEFDATIEKGYIIVGNGGTTVVTTAPGVQPTTVGDSSDPIAQQGQKDFVVKPGTYTVKLGASADDNYVDVMVESGSHKVGLQAVKLDTSKLPKGITFDAPEEESESTGKSWKESNGQYILETLKGGDTVALDDSKPIMSIHFSVADTVAPGKYEFTFSRWHVAEKSDTEFDATIEKGYIIVESDEVVTTTTKAPVTTTGTVATQPITPGVTTAPVAEGKVEWAIPTKVAAKAGSTVEIPVKVNGDSTLGISGAQFKIKSGAAPFDSASLPSVYASKIEFNKDRTEVALRGESGKSTIGKNGDAVATLTLTVPANTPAGEYAVEWVKDDYLSVVDANGNDITNKVTFTNGSILVSGTSVTDGAAEWVIASKVPATAGKTVNVPITVKGDSTLGISGAQFKITSSKAPLDSAVAPSVYAGKIEFNAGQSEVAIRNEANKNTVGKNGDAVITLVLNVPAGTPAGEYPVEWLKDDYLSVVDADGNDITANVKLTNGSILVGGEVAEGSAEWVIASKVPATPGKDVEVPVKVKGDGTLAISGAQFKIKSEAAPFGQAALPSVYASKIEFNKERTEVALRGESGKSAVGKDGDAVATLTLSVPAGLADGEYPVEWLVDDYLSIVDENGNDVTSKVKLTNGSIIVGDVPTTTTAVNDNAAEWAIATKVTAVAGATVEVPVKVVGDSTLGISGAQFRVKSATAPLDSAALPSVYAGKVEFNAGQSEVAIRNEGGKNTIGKNGDAVITLVLNVPAGTAAGEYPVEWLKDDYLSIVDADGNDITANVNLTNGSIVIVDPAKTTTADVNPVTTVPTTVLQGDDTATTTTVSKAIGEGDVVTNTTYSTPSEVVTTAPVLADKQIAWVIGDGKGKPGEEVALTIKVSDEKGALLEVGGGQFILVTPEGLKLVSVEGTPYDGKTEKNLGTHEFAFRVKGAKSVPDGTTLLTVTFQIPENATPGTTFPVDFTGLDVVDENGKSLDVKGIGGHIYVIAPDAVTTTVSDAQQSGETTTTVTETTPIAPVTSTTVSDETEPVTTTTVSADVTPGTSTTDSTPVVQPGTSTTVSADVTPGTSTTDSTPVVQPGTSTTVSADVTPGTSTTATTVPGQTPVVTLTTYITPVTDATTTAPVLVVPTTATVVTVPGQSTTAPTPVDQRPIGWQIGSGEGMPGKEVTLDISVYDPKGVLLEVGGGQFVLATPSGLELVNAEGKPYDGKTEVSLGSGEFAFRVDGTKALPDGTVILKVTYKIPENAVPGTTFPVNFAELTAVDGNGNELNVMPMNGFINVIAPPVSTTTTVDGGDKVTTTTVSVDVTPGTSTTDSTPVVQPVTSTSESTPVTPVTSTSESTPVTPVTSTSESTPVTPVTSTTDSTPVTPVTSTTDSTPVTPVTSTTDSTPVTPVTSTTESTPVTPVTSTTDSTPVTPVTSTTESTPVTPGTSTTETAPITTQAPDDQVGTTTTTATGIDGDDVTKTTTSTDTTPVTPVTTTRVYAVAEVEDGYYFNHDPRTFNAGHVKLLKLISVDESGYESVPKDADMSKVTFAEATNGATTPMDAYREDQIDHTYLVNVLYDGVQLMDEEGKPVQFKVFIGVKGDANLDNRVDAGDATSVLVYYTDLSTGVKPDETLLAASNKTVQSNPELDDLAAFLADVDKDVYSENNWNTKKSGRQIMTDDATTILVFYTNMSTDETNRYRGWNNALPGREEKLADTFTAEEVAKAFEQGGKN